jgi:prepilin-type N-terminal cleavage/methylation domain-containing protein
MPRSRGPRGFTLIELMIVVVIVGVLSFIAIVGYRKWVLNSRVTEGESMLQNIRIAEESFRSENGGYLAVGTSLTATYPLASPNGVMKTQWGLSPGKWAALNVQPDGPVYFGYALIAGDTGAGQQPPTIKVHGASVGFETMTGPWFVANAICDLDNDATTSSTTIYASSGSNQLVTRGEGQP